MRVVSRYAIALALACLLGGCFSNDPYPESDAKKNIYYSTFSGEPRRLDPAQSYSEDEYNFLNQIYEPPLQYHFLKRPYELEPLTLARMPKITAFDAKGQALPDDAPAEKIAKVVWELTVKPGIGYQYHPCFAKNSDGTYVWHLGPAGYFPTIAHPNELQPQDFREVTAEDYVYQMKRLAHPSLHCPIFGTLADHVAGFAEFQERLAQEIATIRKQRRETGGVFYNQETDERDNPIWLDLRTYDIPGLKVVDRYTYQIVLNDRYPQLKYWLAMPFFAPMPWEADRFFSQAAASKQNLTLNRFPVGSGAYALDVNRPNYRMVLKRNPNYHEDVYPSEGSPGDREQGLLDDTGKKLPSIDEAVYVLEREGVPRWNKFLQGYYDASGVGSDIFDQAVKFGATGDMSLTEDMKAQNISLVAATKASTWYFAFNMLDDVVGGYDEKRTKLRQAISIAMNMEEYIQIFENGQGRAAQGPVPPGLFGFKEGREGINPVVYDWDEERKAPKRKALAEARKLLAEAGYPNGIGPDGMQLVLGFDTMRTNAAAKAALDWIRRQFEENLNIQLQIRATEYNQFQEKAQKGNLQVFEWGWNADYPDPENFLFLLYGPFGKVKSKNENAANYENPRFDALFKKLENMDNTPERMKLLDEALAILRHDCPWVWGYHETDFTLYHDWYKNVKPMLFGGNTLKYKRVDPVRRAQMRETWNHPVTWPVWTLVALLVVTFIPAVIAMYRREKGAAPQ